APRVRPVAQARELRIVDMFWGRERVRSAKLVQQSKGALGCGFLAPDFRVRFSCARFSSRAMIDELVDDYIVANSNSGGHGLFREKQSCCDHGTRRAAEQHPAALSMATDFASMRFRST